MSKAKTSFKGIIFLLLIIALVAGVVLLIVFWPQKPEQVKAMVNENVVVLSDDSDFKKEWNKY